MAFQVKIQEVNVENVQKGRNKWQKASVNYLYNNEARTQTILSFSNPEVFKTVQNLKSGDVVSIETAKDTNGYNVWSRITQVGADAPTKAPSAVGGKVLGSNYETPEERKLRQMYIIKQSCISNAIAMLTPGVKEGETLQTQDVLDVAQEFVDFVYGNQEVGTLDSIPNDLPE